MTDTETRRVDKHDHLPSKPLVEALLEIKWGQPDQPDRSYPTIVGMLYERYRNEYPVIEELPLADAPPQIAVQSVRHRFRATEGGWPLVQIGPGVATLNDTEGYTWADFRHRAVRLRNDVLDLLGSTGVAPDISSLRLQYIDAIEFDYEKQEVRDFLSSKLNIDLHVTHSLFEGQPVEDQAIAAALHLEFPSSSPAGRVELRVATGQRVGRPAVVLHTTVTSVGDDADRGATDFDNWLSAAHDITHHWFFALVQGELLTEFLS